jgi:aromatic-L-amino-acid decarboxylase
MLDAKLDLAEHAYQDLAADPLLDVPWAPDLTVIAFRLRDYATTAQMRYLAALNATGQVYLSPITVHGKILLRLCILAHTTETDDVADILRLIHHLARER